jgi:hypothetical protein
MCQADDDTKFESSHQHGQSKEIVDAERPLRGVAQAKAGQFHEM